MNEKDKKKRNREKETNRKSKHLFIAQIYLRVLYRIHEAVKFLYHFIQPYTYKTSANKSEYQ